MLFHLVHLVLSMRIFIIKHYSTEVEKQNRFYEKNELCIIHRYWLVHKNVFESKEIARKIRINIASFEKWYANQIKYHKVTGEKPGKELKSWSYSVKEVADLLEVDDYLVYDLLKKNQMEALSFHSRISSIRH